MKYALILGFSLIPFFSFAQEKYYSNENGKKLDWAMYYLNEYYVDSVDADAITEAALRAIAAELDPYSVYQTAEQLRKQKENDDGTQFIGIGINMIIVDHYPHITSIIKGSSAEAAKLEKGDVIKEVNNQSVLKTPLYQITDLLKGNPGTEVTLMIQRGDKFINKNIKRARVPLISVETSFMATDKIGYVKMIKFTQKTIEEFQTAYQKLKQAGMDALILDMRGNNGGVFHASIELSKLFLANGNLVSYTDGVIAERNDFICESDGDYKMGKVVILTDGITASASEVFCGAMQDWDRALFIGAPSFGKGLIQQSYGFSDSSAIRLTISKYFRPTGLPVQRQNNNTLVFPSEVFVGSETLRFLDDANTMTSMNGRKLYSLGAGIAPDIFYPNHYAEAPSVPYKYIAEYFFRHKETLRANYATLNQLLASHEIEQHILKYDPQIQGRDLAEVKGWLAALIFDTDYYYETISTYDRILNEAIKRIDDDTFDRIGIKY